MRKSPEPGTVVHVVQPIQIVQPVKVVPVPALPMIPEAKEVIPELPMSRPKPTNSEPERIRNEPNNSAPNNSDNSKNSEKPNETLDSFERIGKVGRQRKYEEKGNRGENSVREVVLYRHIKGRHYPGLSNDMKRWYEFFYFKPPMRGEKSFNANTSYEQHTEAYERGQDWIKRYESKHATRPLGHSRIVDLQARRAVN